ncbi:hypothetical protein BEN30_17500 [Magnetovibrio blakemorei]|uniref:Uncharacterized protein n=1 Tax=Magnetovibrio blakemorei TaxID=28181 RepID=A0A1E5Q351_9PROT|nr:hypothetical protein BEN30_17500 [Magnetovibrio blakemorei]
MGSFVDAIVPYIFKTALKTEPVSWGRFFVFVRRLLRPFCGRGPDGGMACFWVCFYMHQNV